MTIEIHALPDERGLRVRDTTEGEQFDLHTDTAVDPVPVDPGRLHMPVDRAVAIDAGELHAPNFNNVFVRQGDDIVAETHGPDDDADLPRDTYEIDFSTSAAKVYVRVLDAPVTKRTASDHTYLSFEASTRVLVGVRSLHRHPEATVTATDDPRDLMRAVSAFGSALKTHTPDRSWPTLRGHPPALELGDVLRIPDAAAPPDTGVTIEVPPAYADVYTVAPLAFYLGATVRPGTHPRILAADATHDLADPLFESVRETLEHVFTLDCAVRSVGTMPVRVPACDRIEARTDLDYDALFETPLAERTAAYLDVDRSVTRDCFDWHLLADVDPSPCSAPTLPHLVNDFALVRSPARTADDEPTPSQLPHAASATTRSASESPPRADTVVPEPTDACGHVWVADGFPVGASKPTVGSFRRTLDRDPGDGPLDVHVVCNDAAMRDETADVYGHHSLADTTVHTSFDLTTTELQAALTGDADFLHFVGHVTENGMVCADGTLDVRTLPRTGVDAFFLNACTSYQQARALVTAGSLGGIATLHDIPDDSATRVGRTVAALLDNGFPLFAALAAVRDAGIPTDDYTILGNGSFALRRTETGSPTAYEVSARELHSPGDVDYVMRHYPVGVRGPGTIYTPVLTGDDSALLQPGDVDLSLPRDRFRTFLETASLPVFVDGELHLTDDLSIEDFE